MSAFLQIFIRTIQDPPGINDVKYEYLKYLEHSGNTSGLLNYEASYSGCQTAVLAYGHTKLRSSVGLFDTEEKNVYLLWGLFQEYD